MWNQKNVSFMPPLSHSWVTFWPGGRWRPRVSKTAPAFSSVCQFPQVIHKKLQPSRRSAPLVRFTQGTIHLVLPPPGWCRGILSHRSDPQGKLQPSAFFSHRRTKLWCGKYPLGYGCAELAQWITAVIYWAHWVIQGSCATQEWEGQ